MQKIFSFQNEGQELILLYDKGKLVYAKKQNENLVFDLEEEELKLIKQVLVKLLPSKNLISMGIFKFHQKNYQHYYDFSNGRHYFYKENSKELPKIEDYILLNKLFNKHVPLVNETEDNEEFEDDIDEEDIYEDSVLETLVNIGEKVIVVLVVLIGLITIDTALSKYGPPEYKANKYLTLIRLQNAIEELKNKFFNNELTFSEIEEAIVHNPNLSIAEKKLYLEDKEFLESQLPYINREDYLDTLEHLYMIYNPNLNWKVDGSYSFEGSKKYSIEVYGTSNFQETRKNTIVHENGHTVSDKRALSDSDSQLFMPFYEFLNRQIKNEYKDIERLKTEGLDLSYSWLESYFHRIVRLFDEETLRKFHAAPYGKYLIEKLVEIIPNVDMAYILFQNLYFYDASCQALNGNEKFLTIQGYDDWQKLHYEASQNIENILKEYYVVKFKENLENEDDMEILYLYDRKRALKIIKEDYQELADISLENLEENAYVLSWPNYFNKERDYGLILGIKVPKKDDNSLDTVVITLREFNNDKNFLEGFKR